ncbi:B-cadherin-like [Anguilla anguilla]|uniref:B-cadherin-like n=1 Tax=Anguilla anguilla TaxID=7936 RepID=UPI0015AC05F4|nr:B-cadherin-like [Anguilla anguilla]
MGAVVLQEGQDGLSPHPWGSRGVEKPAAVPGTHEPQHRQGDVTPAQSVSSPDVLIFPALWVTQSSGNLRRRKRDWVIPPINIPENDRGPFPKTVVQIRSSNAKKMEVTYSITGPGADRSPEGIFTIDRRSGMLFVTKLLDREKKDSYVLLAHAVAVGIGQAEEPMELVIRVTDQNDNKPEFTHNPFLGHVTEGALPDSAFMKVTATDKDDPTTDNGIVRYKIVSQEPRLPSPSMFSVNAVSGVVSVAAAGLDREAYPEYKLVIQVADMEGTGLSNTCTAIVTVTDSNDNAPQFVDSTYSGSVRENEKGEAVVKMTVTDEDEPHTPAWSTKYTIIRGNEGGLFSVHTGPGKMEGLITTAKGLDFENKKKHTLLVTVENEAPFAARLPTSTATVVVNVEDVNEPPVFTPAEKVIKVPEDSTVGSDLTEYAAKDPDSAMKQTVRFQIEDDPARWLTINKGTGLIRVKRPMDRESSFVKDGKYKATILAYDDDVVPATGTGTLIIDLDDVNDNSPLVDQREVSICNEQPDPARLSVIDADGPGNAGPFDVELLGESRNNWTARVNSTSGSVIDLMLKRKLDPGEYHVVLRIYDAGMHFQDSTVSAEVCQCKGSVSTCVRHPPSPHTGGPLSIGVLGAILGLLLLVLLLLMFLRRRSRPMKEEPLLHDNVRDNLHYYDEEGGGEEDQEYDLSQLHRGLDNRPGVFRNDVAPTLVPVPLYRPRPEENEEIGNFIEDNLKAADGDPTAPPYDSLLVFDYEGGGSEAGSLSSLNSSSSGEDQDYDCLAEWGPRFKKLADMYCSGEHCDSETLPSKVVWV